jgi:hypothetical protein
VSNKNKFYFIHRYFFNKVISELGSVDQERSTMAKKKKKKREENSVREIEDIV